MSDERWKMFCVAFVYFIGWWEFDDTQAECLTRINYHKSPQLLYIYFGNEFEVKPTGQYVNVMFTLQNSDYAT